MGEEVVDRSYKVVPRRTYYVEPAPLYAPPLPSFGLCCGRGPDLRMYGPGIDEKIRETIGQQFFDELLKKVA